MDTINLINKRMEIYVTLAAGFCIYIYFVFILFELLELFLLLKHFGIIKTSDVSWAPRNLYLINNMRKKLFIKYKFHL